MMTYSELIKNVNILLVDDDEDYLLMTNAFLKQLGYSVDTAINGKDALEKLNRKDYQILLLDYFMPEMNGEEVIKEIRKKDQELIIILQTGFSGQKPPIETMQNLNIQNYHDKTEGIDRLNLELISAIKIFNQQNQIELAKYRTNAIGNLIIGVAQEIKANLLSVSAGIEVTNMLIQDKSLMIERENLERLNKSYKGNKDSLERVDKVLTAIINQATTDEDYVMQDEEIVEIIKLILKSVSRETGVILNSKIALKAKSYLNGSVNDVIFIVCEILKQLMELQERGTSLDFVLTEDENNWYFNISSDKIKMLNDTKFYLVRKIIISIKNIDIHEEENRIQLILKKI